MASTGDQLQGCTIPEKCMLRPDQRPARRDAFCENDLQCVCKVDCHLGSNKLFSSDCLLKECSDGHDRKAFLRNWLDACHRVGKSGWDDIPSAWEPYFPQDGDVTIGSTTHLNVTPTTTSSSKQSSTSALTSTAAAATSLPFTSLSTLVTTTVHLANTTVSITPTFRDPETPSSTTQPIIVTSKTLSPGAIGGIVAGILLLFLLCLGLYYFYWRASKFAKEKNKKLPMLNDRSSTCGLQQRIDELLAEDNISTGAIMRPHRSVSVRGDRNAGSSETVGRTWGSERDGVGIAITV